MNAAQVRTAAGWALVLIGGLVITQLVMTAGQILLFRITNPPVAPDPIAAVGTYARLVTWAAHPVAAIAAGAFIAIIRPRSKWIGPATMWVLIPIWVSWLRPELMSMKIILQCAVYASLALCSAWFVGRMRRTNASV